MSDRAQPPDSMREFTRRVATATAVVVLILGLLVLFWFTAYVWFALLIGVLIALFLNGLSEWLRRLVPLPHPWAVLLTLLLLAGVLSLVGWFLASPISEQFQQLQQRLPDAMDHVWQQLQSSPVSRYLPQRAPASDDVVSLGKSAGPALASIFKVTLAAVAGTLVALFLGLYMALRPASYYEGLVRLFPRPHRPRTRQVLDEIGITLTRWIFGQLVSMLCVGALIGLGLFLCGIPLSLALGVIAGILDIIPIVGPVAASIPAILLGFTVSPWYGLLAIVVFVVANQLESHILLPVIHRYAVRLPPALTLFALTIMTTLFGVLGALLATPLTAAGLVLVKRLYLEEILEDCETAGD